jgi:putative ABC transport system permease protein
MVVNESFLQALGIDSIEAAIGQQFTSLGYIDGNQSLISTIIGVVPDMKMRSVREVIRPKVFYTSETLQTVLFLKLKTGNLAATMGEVDRVWNNIVPTVPINRSFVEDDFDALYAFDETRGDVFSIFSVFAVLVACLGLFGLAAFEAEHRTREIGIRKVLGARIGDILCLLTWKFIKPVLVANLLAWPVAYYFLQGWLEGYAYRIDLSLLPFISAAAVAICIAWATVGTQAYRVARASPIYALRHK